MFILYSDVTDGAELY